MKKENVQCGLVAGLISAAMLLDAADGLPKVSDANRETVRIMKNIKIPPPYTPTYQPLSGQWYTPPARVTPDYSPKIMPAQLPLTTKSTVVESPAQPVAATNTAVNKAARTLAPAVTPEKAPEVPTPVEKK